MGSGGSGPAEERGSGGVQFGAVDDRAGLGVVAHLLESEGTADHVAGEALSGVGVGRFAANAVMD